MNESRESKNAEQLEELLLLTEEIQEELEQKDQLIEEPVSYTHLDVYKRQGLHRPKRKVFVTSSGGYRQRADREASQSENPTTEKDSFNAENLSLIHILIRFPVTLHIFSVFNPV